MNILRAMFTMVCQRDIRNLLLFYLGYSFRFISPLILYPILTRSLGLTGFGVYATAFSLALMLSVVVEYGFNLSGTRDVAVAKDPAERGRIAARIVAARLILLPAAAVIGVALAAVNPVLHQRPVVAAIAILLGCGQGSTAFWYFQGVGKAITAVILEIGAQLVALAIITFVVSSPADVPLALSIQAVVVVLSALIGALVMFRDAPTKQIPTLKEALGTLKDGFAIFLSRAAIVTYTTISVFLVSGLAGIGQAALFGAAERVMSATTSLLRPLSSVVLPRLAREFALDFQRGTSMSLTVLMVTVLCCATVAVVGSFSAPILVPLLFSPSFSDSTLVLQILLVSLPIIGANNIISNQIMVALRADRAIMIVVTIGGITNILLAILAVPRFGALGMAGVRVSTEIVVLVASSAFAAKFVMTRPSHTTEPLSKAPRSQDI